MAQLYPLLRRRLERIVRFDVTAPDAVIEDACQVAWSRLIRHAHRVDPAAVLSWLAQTARHEALKLLRRDQRELSLEVTLDLVGEAGLARYAPSPHELAEQRERIALMSALPERQRRMLWLHVLGFTYSEISETTGDSPRTVERQLLRAKHRARALAA